jgi:hypothetical protein
VRRKALAVGGAVAALTVAAGLGAASAAPRSYRTVVKITCNPKPSARTYAGKPLYACTARAYSAHGWSKRLAVTYVGNHTYPTSRAFVRATFRGDRIHRARTATASFGILRRPLSYKLAIANKPYDGTRTASVSGCSLTGVVARDRAHVVCFTGGVSASFSQSTIGSQLPVHLSGHLALTGSAARYYTLSGIAPQTVLAADITAEPVIVDTDLLSDAGDAAGLAVADALQLRGEDKLIATILNTRISRPWIANDSVNCAAAIHQYYGVSGGIFGVDSSVTFGGQDTTGAGPADPINNPADPGGIAECAQKLSGSAPAHVTAVQAYRRALAGQPNHSVVIASIGYMENLEALLKSPADAYGPAGATLVAEKVRQLLVMDGCFPAPNSLSCATATNPYNNSKGNALAASYVSAKWPTKVVWSGYEFGDQIKIGSDLSSSQPTSSPVRAAFEKYVGPGNFAYGYDPVTVYSAIRPTDATIGIGGPGTNTINASTGANTYHAGAGNASYLLANNAAGLTGAVDNVLNAVSNGTAPPHDFTDSAYWAWSSASATPEAQSTETVSSNFLQIDHSDTSVLGNVWSRGEFRTQLPFDAVGKSVTVEIQQAANGGAATAQTSVRVGTPDGSSYVDVGISQGWVEAHLKVPGALSDIGIGTGHTYTAGTPLWVRFTSTGSGWTVSDAPDNAGSPGAWTTLATVAVANGAPPASSVDFSMFGGSDVLGSIPAQFANVSVN